MLICKQLFIDREEKIKESLLLAIFTLMNKPYCSLKSVLLLYIQELVMNVNKIGMER